MAKRTNAFASKEGAPAVTPVGRTEIVKKLKAELVARFGEEAVAAASERHMWPKGRGI